MPKSKSSHISDLSNLYEIEKLRKQNAELEEKVNVENPKKFSIAQFEKLKDLPAWFRSLSNNQIAAVDSLTECIRDDNNQNTTHRCRIALLRLGLYPLEPAKNIKFVIKLSRGNDLAFLWFLMELFYLDTCAECSHEKTEYNVNQQILLSAIAHLDMVVTFRELDKIAPKPPIPEPKKRPRVVRAKKKTYISPLLEPLPRPKIGVSLKKRPPLAPIQTLRYEHLCDDPNYIPPNEFNRWYSWPKEQQANLDFDFDETEGPRAIVSRILRDHLYSILDKTPAQKDIRITLCNTHLKLQEIEKERKKIESVIKRDEARKHLSPNERKRMRRKRIIKQIEEDAKRIQDERDERLEYQELHTWIKCFIIDLIWNVTTPPVVEKSCSLDKSCSVEEVLKNQTKKIGRCRCCLGCTNDLFDFGHFGKPKPNEIYFHAPGQTKPYSFDYHKIFKDDVEEKKDPIKSALSKALNLDEYADEDDAITSWLKSTWKKEVEKGNEEQDQKKEKEEEVQKEPEIVNPTKEQIDEMIEGCFKTMKKNPKFVFAALPDAHKHPSVRMWFRQRFGVLKISDEERAEGLARSKKILYKISRAKYKLRIPREEEIGKAKYVPYSLRNYVYSKTKRVLQKFYHEFKMIYLEECRTFWQLMEHRHCTIPPWMMFYAYMPYREYDIMPFRPWKRTEYMDAATALYKRQAKARMEAKYKL